jgi:hypothetical protein
MKRTLIYSLKVWLTTSLVSPLVISLVQFCYISILLPKTDKDLANKLLHELPRLVLGCMIYMVPLGLGMVFFTIRLLSKQPDRVALKRKLSIVTSLLALLPCLATLTYALSLHLIRFYDYYYTEALVLDGLTCAGIAVACIWFYSLNSAAEPLYTFQS